MKKYLKAEYVTNGKLSAIQEKLAEYAASDKWGSNRSCYGCLLCFLGFFVVGPLAPIIGILIYLYYNRYDTEDRRYQLPTQILAALNSQLDPNKDMLLRIDFRESKSPSFITAKRDETAKGLLATKVMVTEYTHNWLELHMYTQRGQRLAVKIVRVGRETVRGSGKNQQTENSFSEIASLSLENFDRGSREAMALEMPASAKFLQLLAGTTGAAVAIQATGTVQGVPNAPPPFDGTDLAVLFELALKQ